MVKLKSMTINYHHHFSYHKLQLSLKGISAILGMLVGRFQKSLSSQLLCEHMRIEFKAIG